ncbi:MAG: HAD family hydrolase [Christensenellales bacterium]|jgi:phosphoglycolate phosphatase-like HAD superfamily hydrolase
MADLSRALREMERSADYLVCVDSDGCVFDTMEIKHKECFIPNTINYWNLQAISKYAREAAEYVNLYSKFRGINRFPALIEVLDLLSERKECIRRGFKAQDIASLRKWSKTETKLGNPALIAYCKGHPEDAVMQQAMEWSVAINETVEKIVRGVPPFPFVRESLAALQGRADVIVVSATPTDALVREWREHGIDTYVKAICGQEMGTKAECIEMAMRHGYAPDRVLMIGDAPGDYNAARKNGCLFYPINPGAEEKSWEKFAETYKDMFLADAYAGEAQAHLIAEFDGYLPSVPPWKK